MFGIQTCLIAPFSLAVAVTQLAYSFSEPTDLFLKHSLVRFNTKNFSN